MHAEDSWPFFSETFFFPNFFFYFIFIFIFFLTETFSETFPMVRFEPGTFHLASECLNHSAILERLLWAGYRYSPVK